MERPILGRWHRAVLILLIAAACAPAADLAETRLGQGINAYNAHDYGAAIQHLRGLASQLPKVSDYVTYHLASAELQIGDVDAAARDLAAYRANPVAASPLAGKIALLHARTLLQQHQPSSATVALQALQKDYKALPQPDGDFALATAYEALDEKPQAALAYVKVYYDYPNTDTAAKAWDGMQRLRPALGKDFPSAPAEQQLDRCRKWLDAKQYNNARQEFAALAASLPEPDRDEAKVGIGATDFLAGDTNAALRYLRDLKVAKSEADAQRLYYVVEAAKKMGEDVDMNNAVKTLGDRYPKSAWRLKALITAGNRYVVTNEREKYEPLFRAAAETFPDDNSTAYCHWKLAWDAYLSDKPEAATLMREQVERYPYETRASSALYFLGRLSEKTGKPAEARAYYDRTSAQFPHYFYGMLSRDRIREGKLTATAPDLEAASWLNDVDWPERRDFSATEPNASTRLRIDRARILMLAGLSDAADTELRFGAKTDNEQPHLLAIELARAMPSPFHALRIMKSFIGDYLSIPFENAPLRFWQMLFPLPYRDEIQRSASAHNLDPYSVAGLIRQETEFNPGARSPSNAYGLMQLIPATGKQMGRQQGIAVASVRSLLNPSINIPLGTQYLRAQLDHWGGNWAETLAAYNAGPSRVKQWLTWANYREPAEFVESIPFNETRDYVQAVLRNADMYRTIYAEKHPAAPDVRDLSDFPPVNLSSLPAAARTPGGGMHTTSATNHTVPKTAAKRRAKSAAVAKKGSGSKRPASESKKSVAGKKAPPKKKEPA
ncbi:MAG TPA: transglycosylase SLT domain-containing protein [Bryobacteraceae bacterium]|nr:transglycosylase SLT domain-containing protein [Bryobacteraceae bacterium]